MRSIDVEGRPHLCLFVGTSGIPLGTEKGKSKYSIWFVKGRNGHYFWIFPTEKNAMKMIRIKSRFSFKYLGLFGLFYWTMADLFVKIIIYDFIFRLHFICLDTIMEEPLNCLGNHGYQRVLCCLYNV